MAPLKHVANRVMRIACMLFVLAAAGWAQSAQNTEVWWMFGGLRNSSITFPGSSTPVSGTAGVSTEIGYAYQVRSTRAGHLWLEVPMTFTWQGNAYVYNGSALGSGQNFWFFTPGVRLKSPTFGRVSFNGSLGGGFATVIADNGGTGPQGSLTAGVSLKVHPAADFAGSIDIRLSRLVSLRGEGRDFVTGRYVSFPAGHLHPVFLVGLAFHF